MDREQCAPPGLLNADDSIVLLIDLQQPFLKNWRLKKARALLIIVGLSWKWHSASYSSGESRLVRLRRDSPEEYRTS